jgi:hypothetical protein
MPDDLSPGLQETEMICQGESSIRNAPEKGRGNILSSFLSSGEGAIEQCAHMLCAGLSAEKRQEIIFAYLGKLEQTSSTVAMESDLPYEKGLIRLAILEELLENPETELRGHLEIAYVQLESFIPYEEFMVMADFKNASRVARQMADTGDPASIIDSARIMKKVKGDRAVSIQEQISDKMKKRLAQLQKICDCNCAGDIPDYSWGLCS